MKKVWLSVVVVLLLIVGAGGWYWFYGPCGVMPTQKAGEQVNQIMQKWIDAEQLASSTPRMSLAGQIQNLQEIRRESNAIEMPACMANVKKELVLAQQASIDGYVAFLGQEKDSVVSSHFEAAGEHMNRLTAEIEFMQVCVPNCP